ncbi:hypothetical protein SBOR_6394 [Sclerotinia borealis F-4128]|uniref:Uncharacterized protein n=1 Tax=Sclerotinia borealis (strain F-4128) TaxID=1432307 RepID=W9CBP1_SCLBF|nr:hypothetical protein SBOR_6394 [Sclerotinia borealis F-4128]
MEKFIEALKNYQIYYERWRSGTWPDRYIFDKSNQILNFTVANASVNGKTNLSSIMNGISSNSTSPSQPRKSQISRLAVLRAEFFKLHQTIMQDINRLYQERAEAGIPEQGSHHRKLINDVIAARRFHDLMTEYQHLQSQEELNDPDQALEP